MNTACFALGKSDAVGSLHFQQLITDRHQVFGTVGQEDALFNMGGKTVLIRTGKSDLIRPRGNYHLFRGICRHCQVQRDETITNLQNEVSRVKSEVERERPLLTKIGELEQKQAIVNTKINALKSIQVSKKRWVVLFENVSSVLPPNMWLTSLNQVSEDNLEMKGMTFDFSEVAEYMVKLEKQASVEKVSLMTISTTKVDGEEAYSFTIKVVMKKDLGDG